MDTPYTYTLVDVKDEIVKSLKLELPKFNLQSVKVIKSDPKSTTELPCIGINRGDDSETQQSITDFSSESYDGGAGVLTRVSGTFFSESLEIRVWHTNADERDRIYTVTKAVLFAIRPDLIEKGLLNLTLRGGRDEQDSSGQNAPEVLYWGAITMSYLNPLDVMYTTEQVSTLTTTTTKTKISNP